MSRLSFHPGLGCRAGLGCGIGLSRGIFLASCAGFGFSPGVCVSRRICIGISCGGFVRGRFPRGILARDLARVFRQMHQRWGSARDPWGSMGILALEFGPWFWLGISARDFRAPDFRFHSSLHCDFALNEVSHFHLEIRMGRWPFKTVLHCLLLTIQWCLSPHFPKPW